MDRDTQKQPTAALADCPWRIIESLWRGRVGLTAIAAAAAAATTISVATATSAATTTTVATTAPAAATTTIAAVAAAAATAITATTAAAAATTARAGLRGTGFVDLEITSLEVLTVQAIHGFLSFVSSFHRDESKAAWAAGLPVHGKGHVHDVSILAEDFADFFLSRFEGQVAHIEFR